MGPHQSDDDGARARYAEVVLRCAEQVPVGHATSYGAIAEAVGAVLGQGGARQVARVMSTHGAGVPWWRVVRADGTLPAELGRRAAEHYSAEGTRRRPGGGVRFPDSWWQPDEDLVRLLCAALSEGGPRPVA